MTSTALSERPVTATTNARVRTAPPSADAHPGVILAVIAAGAFASLLLWWHDTPAVNGLGDWLTNAGRITGLLAGYGVVVLVALMARIPPLERGIGADRLARGDALWGGRPPRAAVPPRLLLPAGFAAAGPPAGGGAGGE